VGVFAEFPTMGYDGAFAGLPLNPPDLPLIGAPYMTHSLVLSRPFRALTLLTALAGVSSAQQFDYVGNIPGGDIWTEGVEAADVDNDGDLDMFFAEGEGFSSAGPARQNRLVLNNFNVGPPNFSDVSVARLGTHLSHAKQVVTADIDGNGWIDSLFVNAFNLELPSLYVNQGAGNPGFFDFDGVARGLTDTVNASDAAFGDPDNDGDMDLIIADSGNSLLGGAGGVPHLYINDGTGDFTRDIGAISTSNKQGHMDLHFVDIDNDFDVDIWGANRVNNHYLLINDGTGNFSDSSGLIPSTSGNVYEADLSDLDLDGDVDMFFISLTGFNEGPLSNQLVESSNLGFTKGAAGSGDDDNEIAFIDYDNDDDLDAVVGSLAGSSEKLRRNDGGMNFVGASTEIESVSDSTLDVAIFDLDGDGDYDIITAQGESNSANWDNKVYFNTGDPDTSGPRVQREEALADPSPAAGPWVVRAEMQDQVMDDGKSWVTAVANYDVDGNVGSVDATISGTGLYRFAMTDTAGGTGAELTYSLTFTDFAGNQTTTTPVSVTLCGYAQYGLEALGSNTMDLDGSGDEFTGGVFTATTSNVPGPASAVFTLICLGSANVPGVLAGTLLVDVTKLVDPVLVAVPSSGSATNNLPIPADPTLVGASIYLQSLAEDLTEPAGAALSNGLRLTICDGSGFAK